MLHYDQDKEAARQDLCRFLAACYYQPGPEFAEEKVFDSMLDAASRIDPDLAAHARRLGEAFSAEGSEGLLVDYTRLFLGPVNAIAKPYGSVWLDGQKTVMGESTMAVLEMYEEGGFEMDAEFHELPDHIAAELEFLYLLIYRENEAHRNGEPKALNATTSLKKRFLDEHLGHVDPAGHGQVAPQSVASSDRQRRAGVHPDAHPAPHREAAESCVQATGERNERRGIEPQRRPVERHLEQRGIVVVADQSVGQARAPRIGRPTDRHTHVPPTRTTVSVLDQRQGARVQDLDAHQSSGRPAKPAASAPDTARKRTRSPGSR